MRLYFIILFSIFNTACYCQNISSSKDEAAYIEVVKQYKSFFDSLVRDFHKNPASQLQWSVIDGNCFTVYKYFDTKNKVCYIEHTSSCKESIEVKFYFLHDTIVLADLYFYEKEAGIDRMEIYRDNKMILRSDFKGKKIQQKMTDFDLLKMGYSLIKD